MDISLVIIFFNPREKLSSDFELREAVEGIVPYDT